MDTYALILAGIGGIVGLLAGFILSAVLPKNDNGGTGLLGWLAILGLTGAGAVFAPPHIEPHAAPYIRQALSDRAIETLPEMAAFDTFYTALEQRDPPVWNHTSRLIREAYAAGGTEAADAVARAEAFRLRSWVLTEYGTRASDEALIAYLRFFNHAVETAVMDDPRSCYAAFYPRWNAFEARPMDTFDIASEDMATALAGIINSAGVQPVEYERYPIHMEGREVLEAAASRNDIAIDDLVRSGRPTSDEEFVTVCQTLVDYTSDLLRHPDGATLYRHTLTL